MVESASFTFLPDLSPCSEEYRFRKYSLRCIDSYERNIYEGKEYNYTPPYS